MLDVVLSGLEQLIGRSRHETDQRWPYSSHFRMADSFEQYMAKLQEKVYTYLSEEELQKWWSTTVAGANKEPANPASEKRCVDPGELVDRLNSEHFIWVLKPEAKAKLDPDSAAPDSAPAPGLVICTPAKDCAERYIAGAKPSGESKTVAEKTTAWTLETCLDNVVQVAGKKSCSKEPAAEAAVVDQEHADPEETADDEEQWEKVDSPQLDPDTVYLIPFALCQKRGFIERAHVALIVIYKCNLYVLNSQESWQDIGYNTDYLKGVCAKFGLNYKEKNSFVSLFRDKSGSSHWINYGVQGLMKPPEDRKKLLESDQRCQLYTLRALHAIASKEIDVELLLTAEGRVKFCEQLRECDNADLIEQFRSEMDRLALLEKWARSKDVTPTKATP